MINTQKLKARIIEKGETIQSIAPKIPCTPYTLGQKINNNSSMTLETAEKICNILDITENDFPIYFFTKKVAKKQRNKEKFKINKNAAQHKYKNG